MARSARFLPLGLIFMLVASVSAAYGAELRREPPPLYSLGTAVRSLDAEDLGVPDAVEAYAIGVNPKALQSAQRSFLIELPSGQRLEAVRDHFVDYRSDWKSWFGTLRSPGDGKRGHGFIYLGNHGDRLTALIEHDGERYRIVGGAFGEPHRLFRLNDDLGVPSCALDELTRDGQAPFETKKPSSKDTGSELTAAVGPTRIDVLAVYPKAFFASAVSEIYLIDFVEDGIALANNIFANSNVNAYYNLTYVGPIVQGQPPATGIFNALTWLTTPTAEVQNLRNAFGADIVTLYVPFYWSADPYCGVANLPQSNNTFVSSTGTVAGAMGDRAFTANRDSCGLNDFTLGHEIGHNYGMRHDDGGTGFPALFPNGRGYIFAAGGQTKATAMGCYCLSGCTAGPSPVCNRIPYFSDPAVNYLGVPTGTATRNNADVARTQVAGYAAFRAQSTNTPPTASFTKPCTGRTCTLNASGSTDNLAIPVGGYWWDFGDGTTGTGKIVNHTYAAGTGTSFWIHLVVTDSGGQQDFGADLVNVP